MGVNFVWRPELYVDAAAISFPAGNGRTKLFIGVCEAAIVLIFVLVLNRIRGGIPAKPELTDELLPLFVGLQGPQGSAFFIRNDACAIFIEPFLPWRHSDGSFFLPHLFLRQKFG